MDERSYGVDGMSCDHCSRAVREEVGALAGVEAVAVDVESGLVTVSGSGLDDPSIARAIEAAGYRPRP